MERIIVDRMACYIVKKALLSPFQSGFRKGQGTINSVVCLETEIKKAHIKNESALAIFLDVEKAYNMTWKEGLLIKLAKLGIKGITCNWFKDFFI